MVLPGAFFSCLPSYAVALSSRWCRLCTGAACQSWRLMEEFPVLCGWLVAQFALGNLDFAFAFVSFSPSVFGCCLWSTSYFRDAYAAWFNSGYIIYGRLWTNFKYFLRCGELRSRGVNGEVCTVDAPGCSFYQRVSHVGTWTIFLRVLHFLEVFGVCFLLLSAAGALDDEEFFVIVGSM